MPKAKKAKNATGKGPRTRTARAEPAVEAVEEVERVELFQDNTQADGNAPVPVPVPQNVIDFESFLRDSGLLEAQRCGGAHGLNEVINGRPNDTLASSRSLSTGIEQFRSFSDEVYVHIPNGLREQIWRGEFINLALLLKGAVELNDIWSANTFVVSSSGVLEAARGLLRSLFRL